MCIYLIEFTNAPPSCRKYGVPGENNLELSPFGEIFIETIDFDFSEFICSLVLWRTKITKLINCDQWSQQHKSRIKNLDHNNFTKHIFR